MPLIYLIFFFGNRGSRQLEIMCEKCLEHSLTLSERKLWFLRLLFPVSCSDVAIHPIFKTGMSQWFGQILNVSRWGWSPLARRGTLRCSIMQLWGLVGREEKEGLVKGRTSVEEGNSKYNKSRGVKWPAPNRSAFKWWSRRSNPNKPGIQVLQWLATLNWRARLEKAAWQRILDYSPWPRALVTYAASQDTLKECTGGLRKEARLWHETELVKLSTLSLTTLPNWL